MAQEITNRREWIAAGLVVDVEDDDDTSEVESDNDPGSITTKKVKVLDYGCGTGTLSRALAPFATDVRGIDVSANMVAMYNQAANNQGLYPDEMSAVLGDLLHPSGSSPSVSGPEFFEFDLAVVGLGLHHFEKPKLAVERLVARLKPGTGVLLVIDFLPHQPIPGEAAERTVAHQGFGKAEMVEMMRQAGCEEVKYVVLGKGITLGHGGEKYERSMYMCRGTRVT